MDIHISRSKKKDKKFDAVIDGKKTISFGAKGYSDMTQHKDEERKKRYVSRHKKNENWKGPKTPGFYAQRLLWNKPTLQASVADLKTNLPKLKAKLKV